MTATTALPDVNVLLALVWEKHVHHHAAHAWYASVDSWATTAITEAGLVRLLLNPTVVGGSVSGAAAIGLLRRLRRQEGHRQLVDDASLADAVVDLDVLMGHRQVTDLHLVNLAATSGCRLATFDARLRASLAPADRVHVELVPV